MVVIVRATLLRTPLADICAQLTDRVGKATLSRHRLCTQQTDVDALTAAVRAIVVAIHVHHRIQAFFAGNRTVRFAGRRSYRVSLPRSPMESMWRLIQPDSSAKTYEPTIIPTTMAIAS